MLCSRGERGKRVSIPLESALAVHRFGLGARPGELSAASADARGWLIAQLDATAQQPVALDGTAFRSAGARVAELLAFRQMVQQQKALGQSANPAFDPTLQRMAQNKADQQELVSELEARYALGVTTDKPFLERLVWFWSNHFTVSAQKFDVKPYVGAFEREAIRPHVTGTFSDMLLAVTRHPAMLLYLDNAQSIGPGSPAGLRSGKGLNENLGRELMELHTLGVDGGYTQADVIAMAKILTGWTLGDDNGFAFRPNWHEPGAVVLRGKTYDGGENAGVAALADLARDPATARHVAKQFATGFIADDPPSESVARLERVFNDTGGDLKALASAAVKDSAAWKPENAKMRSPVEYVTASLRLVGWPHDGDDREKQMRGALGASRMMGEVPLSAPSPKGWPMQSSAWSGPDALLNRIAWARALGNHIPFGVDALAMADETLGPLLRADTRGGMRACSTPGEALALLVSSPEFQRR